MPHNSLGPVGIALHIVHIGAYRCLKLEGGNGVGFGPIRSASSRNFRFDFFSRISHGIVFLPHLSPSSLSAMMRTAPPAKSIRPQRICFQAGQCSKFAPRHRVSWARREKRTGRQTNRRRYEENLFPARPAPIRALAHPNKIRVTPQLHQQAGLMLLRGAAPAPSTPKRLDRNFLENHDVVQRKPRRAASTHRGSSRPRGQCENVPLFLGRR